MRRKDVKTVIAYYCAIPAMRRELASERSALEAEYDGLRGTSADGSVCSHTAGKPVEELAGRVETRRVWARLEAISVRDQVLAADRERVQDALDCLKSEYKRLLLRRYRDRYSWVKIAARHNVSERGAYRMHDKALDRLGEALDETPMLDELLLRASRARG